MDCNRKAQDCCFFHALPEGLRIRPFKVFDATVGHEGFESHYPTSSKRFQLIDISRNQSTPQREIGQGRF